MMRINLHTIEIERQDIGDDSSHEVDYAAASWLTFLIKEKKQFVGLIDKITNSLKQTYEVLEGIRTEDRLTMSCFEAIQSNQTPNYWTTDCYPTAKVLSEFISNLMSRIKNLEQVIKDTNEKKDVRNFKFGFFYDQRAFFTTLLQQVSRKSGVSIETLSLSFRCM